MATNFYGGISVSGGGVGALDRIDGALLQDADGAIIIESTSNILYIYTLNASIGDGNSPPQDEVIPSLVAPDSNYGLKRWQLCGMFLGNTFTDNRILRADGTGKVQNSAATIDDNGDVTGVRNFTNTGTMQVGSTLKLTGSGGNLEHNQAAPSGTVVLGYNGYFYATKVFNPVYADYVDWFYAKQHILIQPGKCYYETGEGLWMCDQRMQRGVIGMCSDTYGMAVGMDHGRVQVPIAVAGRVLAIVDREYPPGTPLTNNDNGDLTAMTVDESRQYPERIIAIYMYKERNQAWGPEGAKINVFDRHWVKVR